MPKTQTIKLAAGDDAVLLIHGLASSPLEMTSLATALKQRGFSVEVPHILGFGFGTDVTCCEDWLAQVVENFDRLKREYRTVSVGGLCIGSVLSLALAIERPREVNALSLLSTTLFYDGWSIPWYRFLMPLWFHTPVRHLYEYTESEPYGIKNPQIRARVARAMRKGFSEAGAARITMDHVYQASRLARQVMRDLHRVTAPALVIHAIDDETASPKSAEHVFRNIGSAEKRKVFLGDSYHMITLDNERDAVATETNAFFKAHAAAALPQRASAASGEAAAPRLAASGARRQA
jgi:carboxylesterase